jgi:hypothetical protein
MAGEVGVRAPDVPGRGQAAGERAVGGGETHVQQPFPIKRTVDANLVDRLASVDLH